MKKILLLLFAVVFLYKPIEITAQDYLKSATATGNGTTTNNSKVWTDLTSVSIDLGSNTTDTKYVLVTASINMRPDGLSTQGREANYNIYRYDDDTDKSGVIKRQIIRNSETGVESWGIGTLVHIFDVGSLTGSKTYTLEHSNQGVSNDGRNVYSSARFTAVALSTATNHYELSNDVKRLDADVTTTSSTYAAVTGTTTDAITLPIKGDIFVIASINGKAVGVGSVAEYKLEYSTDGGSTWADLGKSVKRSMINSYDDGIVSLVCMLQDQNADNDFKFRVSHRRVSGTNTITTHNCNLVAFALAHSGDGYFPSFYSEVGATGVDADWGDPYELVTAINITAAADISGTGTSLFVSSQFLIDASNLQTTPTPDERMRAGNQLYADDGTTTLYADEYYRYTPDNSNFGAGGFAGLMTDMEDEGSYTIGMNHKVVAVSNHTSPQDEILTTSQVILTGFQTYDQNGLSGSYDIGVGGDYTSLSGDGGLFADINAAGLCGNVTANIISDITETGANQLAQWTEYDGTDYTLTIQPDGTTLRTLSSTVSTPVYFNGADRVTINGGAGKDLAFKCTSTSSPVFHFEDGAISNTITNCNIESDIQSFSSNLPGNGAILIFASGTDIDNEVTISNCNISSSGVSVPMGCGILVYSSHEDNTNTVTVSNNNIYNFAATTATDYACGIYLRDDGALASTATASTISGNSFYCNLTTNPTSHQISILIDGGDAHTISGNYIGGQSASCGGSAWNHAATATDFYGIYISNLSNSVVHAQIENNTISNISANNFFYGIYSYLSNTTVDGNTIGHASTANSITLTGGDGYFYGIEDYNNTTSSFANTITDNTIANVIHTATYPGYTYGINLNTVADVDVKRNKIYGIGPQDNTTYYTQVYGISIENPSGGTACFTLVNNVISLGGATETGSDWYSVYDGSSSGISLNLLYNSLYLSGTSNDDDWSIAECIARDGTSTFYSKNNIFYNSRSDDASDEIYYIANTGGSITSDNNIFYVPSGDVAYYGSASYTTLADWQTASSKDGDSYSVDPHYTSSTNLQPQTGYYKPGTDLSGITTIDIDGTTRNDPPSIGAYEGTNYHNVWAGIVSTAWNTAGNWDVASVPAASDNVTIADVMNDPVIDNSGVVQVNGLTVNSGATLTLSAGAQVTVNGNLTTNDGLTIQNTVASPTSLINKGTVIGDVSVEWTYPDSRYMYVGHSVDGVTYSDYSAVITDPVNNLWLYRWPGSWTRITSDTDLDGNEHALEGYAVKTQEGGDVTVEYLGALRYGTYSSTFNGYKLVANPYATYIDLEGLGTDIGTVTEPTIWTSTNASTELVYATYNISTDVGANDGTRYIAPGQSFWIEHSVSSDLTVRPGLRTYGDGGVLKGASITPDDILRLSLINDNEIQSDEVVMLFRQEGTVDEVTMNDSKKRIGTAKVVPNVYALKGTAKVVIAAFPEAGLIDTVRIGYKFAQEKEITLRATNMNEFRAIDNVYLFDKKAGVEVNLRETPEYTFTSTAGEDTDRFEIYFTHLTTGINDYGNEGLTGDKILIYGTGSSGIVKVTEDILAGAEGKGVIRVYSAVGSLLKEVNLTNVKTTIDLPDNHGMYVIEVRAGDMVVTGKVTRMN